MTPLTKILHPTDFSECSNAALPLARSLARDHGAQLIVLHVAPLEIVPDGAYVVPMNPEVYKEALDELRGRLEGADLKATVETLLRQGNAADEILEAAKLRGVDLIVMGTHGRTGLGRLILGSVAEAVMRHATCPVLTVKMPHVPAPTKAKVHEEKSVLVI